MIACKQNGFLFLAVTKTSTRSIYEVLLNHYGGTKVQEHLDIVPENLKDLKTFVVSRNPYDRFISMWWSTCMREGDRYKFKAYSGGTAHGLIDWMLKLRAKDRQRFARLLTLQADYHRPNRIDHVIRFENLQEDFSALPFITGYDQLPHNNPTINSRGHWADYYDPVLIDKVNEYYAEDFELLGYEML